MKRSSTETLIAACRELAATVQCGDGVANEALREIAERLEELARIEAKRDETLLVLRDWCNKWMSLKTAKRLIEDIK